MNYEHIISEVDRNLRRMFYGSALIRVYSNGEEGVIAKPFVEMTTMGLPDDAGSYIRRMNIYSRYKIETTRRNITVTVDSEIRDYNDTVYYSASAKIVMSDFVIFEGPKDVVNRLIRNTVVVTPYAINKLFEYKAVGLNSLFVDNTDYVVHELFASIMMVTDAQRAYLTELFNEKIRPIIREVLP